MPDSMDSSLDPNILANMIRQQKLIGTFSGGGLPSPMPVQPDMTVHVHHALGLPDNQPTVPDDDSSLQTGVAPSPTQATPQSTNIPKVGPINPNSTDPAESAYKQALMNEPMHSDYHPSKLRNILSTIAGMGVGAFQGPDQGAAVRQGLRDAPFIGQHQDWAQYSGNKEKLATEEAAGDTTAGKAALTQAQIAEQNSLASLHGGELNNKVRELNLMRNTPEEVVADKVAEAQGRLKVDTREAEMLDGTIRHLIHKNGLFYDPDKTMPDGSMLKVDRSAIKDYSDEGKTLKDTKQARIPGNLGESVKASKIIAAGVGGKTDDGIAVDQATFDAAKDYKAKLDKGSDPKGAFDSIVKTMEDEKGRKLTSSEMIKLDNSLRPPIGPTILGPADTTGSRPVLPLKPGMSVPAGSQTPSGVSQENTDTAPTRQMAETAPHVISLLDKIDKQIDENVKSLGPAAGRWNEFMTGKVGAQDPKFAALRTNVALAKTLIMRMHLGSRGGQGMYEHFNNMLDLAGSDPENLKAATRAIRDYATDVSKGSHGGNNNAPVEEYVRDPKSGKLVLKGQ